MATVPPVADQASHLLQSLSLDSKKKSNDATEVSNKTPTSGGEATVASLSASSVDRSGIHFLPDYVDSCVWYPSGTFYYGGYDGSIGDWEDYPTYVSHDGAEMLPLEVYGDIYHQGYGFAPYNPYPSPGSPIPTVGNDGKIYSPQPNPFTKYYQAPTPSVAQVSPDQLHSSQVEAPATILSDKSSAASDTVKINPNSILNGISSGNTALHQSRPDHHSSSLSSNGSYFRSSAPSGLNSSGYPDAHFGFGGRQSPIPWFDTSVLYAGRQRAATNGSGSSINPHAGNSLSARNHNGQRFPQVMGLRAPRQTPGFMNRMYSHSRLYGQCGTTFRTGFGYRSNGHNTRTNQRWSSLVADTWYKPRGRANSFYGYGSENTEGPCELNKGPRSDRSKIEEDFGSGITIAVKGQGLTSCRTGIDFNLLRLREQYNKEDFPDKYSDAKFFIIKSYSEDDVHKSIKYNAWASTRNGNKKLDAAYEEAREKPGDCPVFLFFSVNSSGQFVGVAQMVGPVDFDKTVNYWQQDKWNGCFPVKWHIVKDVPNSILKHIMLENNDNKPVTHSRDSQEVNLEQGHQLLKLFKEHVSKTCILDDFGFYETRQRLMQERRVLQAAKQAPNIKAVGPVDGKDFTNGKIRLKKPLEAVSILKKESFPQSGSVRPKLFLDKGAKPAPEKNIAENGAANGI